MVGFEHINSKYKEVPKYPNMPRIESNKIINSDLLLENLDRPYSSNTNTGKFIRTAMTPLRNDHGCSSAFM